MRCCALTGLSRLHERSDSGVRTLEGLASRTGWLRGEGDHAGDDPRTRLDVGARRGHRPQDRLLPRPARQPSAVRPVGAPVGHAGACSTATATPAASASPPGRRRGARSSSVDSSAPALEQAQGATPGCNGFDDRAQRVRRCRRQPDAARPPAGRRDLRRHRARPAEVRAHRGACRARRARLQGHQPPGAEAAGAWRACCSRSPARAASGPSCSTRSSPAPASMPASNAAIVRRLGAAPRPPDDDRVSRGRIPQGPGVDQERDGAGTGANAGDAFGVRSTRGSNLARRVAK